MKNKNQDNSLEPIALKQRTENEILDDGYIIVVELWKQSLLFSVCFIIAEWFFLVTKPTFDVRVQFSDKVSFLIFSIALWSLILSAILSLMFLLSKVIRNKGRIILLQSIGCLFPSLIITLWVLMIFDNFTYTIFQFGLLTIPTFFRIVYLTLFFFIGFLIFRTIRRIVLHRAIKFFEYKYRRRIEAAILIFLAFDLIIIGSQYKSFEPASSRENYPILRSSPNIILITADGLNADHMSVYGYHRKTTPHIDEISENSLVAMNAFTNASDSQGSIISILTGKSPAETRVLFSPDILMGDDSYDHLPGILHDAGYSTYQFGDPFYVDANVANMMGGFDYVNNLESFGSFWYVLNKHFPPQHQIFMRILYERISDRVKHLFWLEKIRNPGDILSDKTEYSFDFEKIETIKTLFATKSGPVFIHLHLLGTHGPKYLIHNPVFSKERIQKGNWDVDYYDDSILEFDSLVGELFSYLKDNNLSNSIIIIGSDHGQQWSSNVRIPLIFHFPDTSLKSRIYSNTQNIDIYPTLLDYLGIGDFYSGYGSSLLNDIPNTRSIISLGVNTISVTEEGRISFRPNKLEPPFFQFGYINLIHCDMWFKINFDQSTFDSGIISNSLNSCNPDQRIDNHQALDMIIDYLDNFGFSTTLLSEKIYFEINRK